MGRCGRGRGPASTSVPVITNPALTSDDHPHVGASLAGRMSAPDGFTT